MTWFITVYQNSWGRGSSPEESKKQARAAGGTGNKWYTKRLPPGAVKPYVNDMGAICWMWTEKACPDDPEDAPESVLVACGRGMPEDMRAQVVTA